jgi:hypothetical protein
MAHIGEELRLVLARFCKLTALVLNFIEESDVLDRDNRLVGKCGRQTSLLLRLRHGKIRARRD